MLNTVLNKTKEQITKKRQEIAKLEAEVELLEAKLREQTRLMEEYNKAKELMAKAAQDLVDSQFFEYEDVVEDCKEVVKEVKEGRGTKPVGVVTTTKVKEVKPEVSQFAKGMNIATKNINKLSEDIDKGLVTKEEAARLLMNEIDGIIKTTKYTPKIVNGTR